MKCPCFFFFFFYLSFFQPFGFQTILSAILIRFTSNLEYSLDMGLARSLLILVDVGALGCTCAPKGAPWFPDDPDRNYHPIHFKFRIQFRNGSVKKPIDFGAYRCTDGAPVHQRCTLVSRRSWPQFLSDSLQIWNIVWVLVCEEAY